MRSRFSDLPNSLAALVVMAVWQASAGRAAAGLYAVNASDSGLVTIDRDTASIEYVGRIDHSETIRGLVHNTDDGLLYGVDPGGTLLTIDRITGKTRVIGEVAEDRVRGLAYDSRRGTLFASRVGPSRSILAVDTSTGEGEVFTTLENRLFGLTYHAALDTLLGVDVFNDVLVSVDPVSGAEAVIGSIESVYIGGLAYDPTTNTVFAASSVTDALYTIDPVGGDVTLVGPISLNGIDNLTYIDADPPVAPIAIPGDYNNDDIVDVADYTVWRGSLNTNAWLPGDTTPGAVTIADYRVWRANFGRVGSSSGAVITPEPSSLLLAGLVSLYCVVAGRRSLCSIFPGRPMDRALL